MRVGFVGAGGIARRHVGVLTGFEDVEIVGVTDVDAGRAQDLAAGIGADTYADPRILLAHARPDALFICVSSSPIWSTSPGSCWATPRARTRSPSAPTGRRSPPSTCRPPPRPR